MGRIRYRAKTKTVLEPVKQWEQLGNMPNWKLQTFLNKNQPNQIAIQLELKIFCFNALLYNETYTERFFVPMHFHRS